MRPSETSAEKLLPLSTDAELRRRFMVLREPIPGNFRFGVLLEVLDRLAGETALQYIWRGVPDAGAVTAALDEVVVRRAPDVTQDVRCSARINHVGRTSMEVGIRVEHAADRTHLASCYFTMVARDRRAHAEHRDPAARARRRPRARARGAGGGAARGLPARAGDGRRAALARRVHDARRAPPGAGGARLPGRCAPRTSWRRPGSAPSRSRRTPGAPSSAATSCAAPTSSRASAPSASPDAGTGRPSRR